MGLLTLEHSKAAYRIDFAVSGGAVMVLAGALLACPAALRVPSLMFVVLGLASWSFLEYAVHRFLLHGLQPFQRWHAMHHQRPTALIYTPTVMVAALIATFVFLPAWMIFGPWPACGLTLGVLAGNLAYAITHHATHHWPARSAWMQQRKRWHARHHHAAQPVCYGVTSAVWDHVFRSAGRVRRATR